MGNVFDLGLEEPRLRAYEGNVLLFLNLLA